jgi:hypothetical protein
MLAMTAEECLHMLRKYKGQVNVLSLDHDLQDFSEDEKHGFWLVKRMVDEGLYADIICLHTANGEGKKNMYYYLTNAIKHGVLPSHIKVYSKALYEYQP